jgi:hypothetical protein
LLRVEELVVDEFGDGKTLLGVLGEAMQDEVLDFRRGRLTAGEINLIVDYFAQIVLRSNFEGDFAKEKLIG